MYKRQDWAFGSKLEPRMVPPHVILSVSDAQRLGVAIGEPVTLGSEVGTVTLPAQIDSGLAAGTPVSYTHLDVYKRQGRDIAAL